MKYRDIFEFQEVNKTKEEKAKAFSTMSEEEAKELISTCGTVQGKLFYTNLFKSSKENK